MSSIIFQVVSHLGVTPDMERDADFEALVVPMAQYLLVPGNIGNPWLPGYARFLEWASAHWERVWFVPGALEYGCSPEGVAAEPPTPDDVDAQCRFLAAKHHNVRCMQVSCDRAFPGLVIVGAACWPPAAQASHSAYLARAATQDALVLTHAPLDGLALPCTSWVTAHTNPRTLLLPCYDPTFYLTIPLPAGTVSFVCGREPFPPFTRAHVTLVDDREAGCVCFYCGHRNHTKFVCPLIQCNTCGRFGHSERVCGARLDSQTPPGTEALPWEARPRQRQASCPRVSGGSGGRAWGTARACPGRDIHVAARGPAAHSCPRLG